jgi:hypothetical protein
MASDHPPLATVGAQAIGSTEREFGAYPAGRLGVSSLPGLSGGVPVADC